MVNAGEMRHVVRIERQTEDQESSGQLTEEWELVAQRRAAIVRTTGREVFAAQQQAARVPTLFRLRFIADVMPSMRLLCDGRVYDIKSAVDPTGRGEELLVTTEERVGEEA